jgi:hypothetical protein
VTVRVPVIWPAAVGVKVTLIVQEVLGATLPEQLLVWLKLALVAMLVIVSVPAPVFLRVAVWGLLGEPTFWLPNARLRGDKEATGGGGRPLPARLIASGLLAASLVMMTLSGNAPVVVGVKVTLTVQWAPAASVVGESGQSFVCA